MTSASIWNAWRIVGAGNEFDAAVKAYHQRGEKVLPEDFDAPAMKDDENAATFLRRAADEIKIDEMRDKLWNDADFALPLRTDEIKCIETVKSASGDVLAQISEAKKRTKITWGNVPAGTGLPALNPMRAIATFLSRSAKLAHQKGNDEEAMARIEDVFFVARMTDEQPTFIGHLVAIGIEATATDTLTQICEDLQITPQTRLRVEAIIAELLKPRDISAGLWWQGERASSIAMSRSNLKPGQPMPVPLQRGLVRTWNMCDQVREASKLPNYQAAMAIVKKIPEPSGRTAEDRIVAIMTPSMSRSLLTNYRICADRRMVATALAIRLYTVDHNNTAPADLKSLLPKYLPAIPEDPFAVDAAPVRYLPHKSLLYSVYEDGVDDGGKEHPDDHPTHDLDLVCTLKRPPRKPPEAGTGQ
jgi:hypothetical protein